MGKPDFCLGENKGADQLRSNCEADQRLCFRYTDSTIPVLSKSKISSLQSSSVLVQLGLCQTWSETPKTGFLASRLNFQIDLFHGKPCCLTTWKINANMYQQYLASHIVCWQNSIISMASKFVYERVIYDNSAG